MCLGLIYFIKLSFWWWVFDHWWWMLMVSLSLDNRHIDQYMLRRDCIEHCWMSRKKLRKSNKLLTATIFKLFELFHDLFFFICFIVWVLRNPYCLISLAVFVCRCLSVSTICQTNRKFIRNWIRGVMKWMQWKHSIK